MRDLLDVYVVTGQIGTGKTTTAERLRAGLGIPSIDRDSIREELGIYTYNPQDKQRIDEIVWERVEKAVRAEGSVSIGVASAVQRGRRQEMYTKLESLSSSIGRRIDCIFLECVCSSDEAKRRIALRSPKGAATHLPGDYDKLASVSAPIDNLDLDDNRDISFLRLDTQINVLEVLAAREAHLRAIEVLTRALAL